MAEVLIWQGAGPIEIQQQSGRIEVSQIGRRGGEVRVFLGTDSDDAEEAVSNGAVDISSTDLEIGYEGSVRKIVGLRFTGLGLFPGATIVSAYVQFTAGSNSGAQTATPPLVIEGAASVAPATFSTSAGDISGRARTTASVVWDPPSWLAQLGQRGLDQRTADLTAIVQELVDLANPSGLDAIALIFSENGGASDQTVTARSQQSGADGPELVISWVK